jgi:hypothetical protein
MALRRRFFLVRLSVVGLLAACGSTPPSVAPTTGATTSSVGPTTTMPADTTTTVVDTTVPATAASDWILVRDVDDRDPAVIVVTFEKVDLDGTVTVLFRENTQRYPTPLDVDAARSTALMRRTRDPVAGGLDLVEYDLRTGSSRLVLASTDRPEAEYADDGSGNLIVMDTVPVAGGAGTSLGEGTLRVLSPAGAEVAVLERRQVEVSHEIAWRQLVLPDGTPAIALAGRPMLLTLADAAGQWCRPVRVSDGSLLGTCTTDGDQRWRHQLWSFPLDGAPATQLTHIDSSEVADFGAFDLWRLPGGRVYVQRFGDCGADWVEALEPDGTLTKVDTIGGTIIGQFDGRLVTVTSGSCEGNGSSILSVDPVTGDSVTLAASQFPDHPTAVGIDPMGVVWVSIPTRT